MFYLTHIRGQGESIPTRTFVGMSAKMSTTRTLWLPTLLFGLLSAGSLVFAYNHNGTSAVLMGLWGLGFVLWTFVEYCVHRFLGHHPDPRWDIDDHRYHHRHPTQVSELVFEYRFSATTMALFTTIAWIATKDASNCFALISGFSLGYLCYEWIHMATHVPQHIPFFSRRTQRHRRHHSANGKCDYGITTGFWDCVFRTTGEKKILRTDRFDKLRHCDK